MTPPLAASLLANGCTSLLSGASCSAAQGLGLAVAVAAQQVTDRMLMSKRTPAPIPASSSASGNNSENQEVAQASSSNSDAVCSTSTTTNQHAKRMHTATASPQPSFSCHASSAIVGSTILTSQATATASSSSLCNRAPVLGLGLRSGLQQLQPWWQQLQPSHAFHSWYYQSKLDIHEVEAMQSVAELVQLYNAHGQKWRHITLAVALRKLTSLLADPQRQMLDPPNPEAVAAVVPGGSSRALGFKQAQDLSSAVAADPQAQRLAQQLCSRIKRNAQWFDPRYASMAVFCSGRLGVQDPAMIDAVLGQAALRIEEAYSQDLYFAVKGLDMHGHPGPEQWWPALWVSLGNKLGKSTAAAKPRVPPSNLAGLLVSSVRLGRLPPPGVATLVGRELLKHGSHYKARDLTAAMWALARAHNAGSREEEAADSGSKVPAPLDTEGVIAVGRLMDPTESNHFHLQGFVWASATLLPDSGEARKAWLEQHSGLLAATIQGKRRALGASTPAHLVELIWTCARLGWRPDEAFLQDHVSAAAALLPGMSQGQRARLKTAYAQLKVMDIVMAKPALATALGLGPAPQPAAAAAAPAAPAAPAPAPQQPQQQ